MTWFWFKFKLRHHWTSKRWLRMTWHRHWKYKLRRPICWLRWRCDWRDASDWSYRAMQCRYCRRLWIIQRAEVVRAK